jgi:casein kinase 1
LGFEETPDYDFLRDLFTKVLKNHGDTDDELYDWMLLNNGRGIEKKSFTRHHHQQVRQSQQQREQQPAATAMATRNTAVVADNPYGRNQQMNTNNVQQHEYDEDNDDSRKNKGFWKQFISFVTCGFLTCF